MKIQPGQFRGLPARLKRRALRSGALMQAGWQLLWCRCRSDSPWRRQPAKGHLRGIDFYTPTQLLWVVANAMRDYRNVHGCYPNLLQPGGFNEKVFWFKFFGELRVPQAGDKLAIRQMLPASLQGRVRCLPVVWQSPHPSLPDNDTLPAGVYYLKANLGSGLFKRITYPLSPDDRLALEQEAKGWLASEFGLSDGEWWYQTFTPILFLEQSVAGDADSISWNFYTLNGQVPMIGMFIKHADGRYSSTWLDAQFQRLPHQSDLNPVDHDGPPVGGQEMLALAREIGASFNAVRVDFLQGDDGLPYLCELTFAAGNALTRRHRDVEHLLGDPWQVMT